MNEKMLPEDHAIPEIREAGASHEDLASQAKHVYATLSGTVDAQIVQRVFAGFAVAVNNKVDTVHLLLQSTGGFIGDGVCLYNYLKHLPLNLIIYNGGSVMSIAVIAFLAAKIRKASASATFMIHRSFASPTTTTTVYQLQNLTESLLSDDARTEKILREYLSMPDEKWKMHEYGNLTLTADEAMKFGLIHEIADFQVPPGFELYNI